MSSIRLDVGCGKNKKEGFIGVDQYPMDGVDLVCDLREKEWKVRPCPPAIGFDHPEIELVAANDSGSLLPAEGYARLRSDSVEEVHCSHFLEHLTGAERVCFFNELYRIMKPGAKATIIVPHWGSNRAYGDPTHQWPPVSEMAMYYLSKDWRKAQAPHTDSEWNPDGYNCDFEAVWGYSFHPALAVRAPEHQQYAMSWYKEACQDMHISLTKKVVAP